MSLDDFEWAGLTPDRWAVLLEKLRGWIRTERTPARILRVMQDDINIGYREQLVLAYWLGYIQTGAKHGLPAVTHEFLLKARLN